MMREFWEPAVGPAMVVAAVAAVEYVALLVAVALDFRAGVRKARERGERRTSRGFRRTVGKAAQYFAALLSMSLMDVPLVVTMLYCRVAMHWPVPCFPLLTTVGALAMIMIEGKSIRESAASKLDLSSAIADIRDVVAQGRDAGRLTSLLESILEKMADKK